MKDRETDRQPPATAVVTTSSHGPLEPGMLVRSLAGRDKGRYYLVCARAEDGFLWVSDGRKRPAGRMKRKNVRHLQPVRKAAADLAATEDGRQFRDEEVRAAIMAMANVKEGE